MRRLIRIALCVGEASGDVLGARLLRDLKDNGYDIECWGIAGEHCLAEGAQSLYPMEKLSLMGFYEPIKRLPELYKIQTGLLKSFLDKPPDVFLGIDAPDFNLRLAYKLKKAGIKCCHYVSPTIWAWRPNRVHFIKKAVDLMLCLFPFEPALYQQHGVQAVFVGHRFAQDIPLDYDPKAARYTLGYGADDKILALLPGSRTSEITRLGPLYLQTAQALARNKPELKFICPVVSARHAEMMQEYLLALDGPLVCQILIQKTRLVMQAATLGLITSGTASLEMLLHHKPMVVAYKTHFINYWLARFLVKTRFIALPNILSGRLLVPEYIQNEAHVVQLTQALEKLLQIGESESLKAQFKDLHKQLLGQANSAARALIQLINLSPA